MPATTHTPKLSLSDRLLARTLLPFIPRTVTPNSVTVLRFVLTPFVFYSFVAQQYGWGLILFVLIAFTDAVDGALARTRNLVTDWGKLYDPLADKLLIGGAALIVIVKELGAVLAFVIVAIELLLILNGAYQREVKHRVIQAVWVGKLKMILQCVGVGILLLALLVSLPWLLLLATGIFYVAIALGFASFAIYRSI